MQALLKKLSTTAILAIMQMLLKLFGNGFMVQYHFVEEYEAFVESLVATHPLDEAMSLAVGGDYEAIGDVEKNVLVYAGLKNNYSVLDYGCGSGRLAYSLSKDFEIQYTGVDVVDALLDYARQKTPEDYVFVNHQALNVPKDNASQDIICAFSLFTHLFHHETYLYLEDMYRALKPGGKLIFSFLEFAMPTHWNVFAATVNHQRNSVPPILNTFIERNVIREWSKRLSFKRVELIGGNKKRFAGQELGQSVAILQK